MRIYLRDVTEADGKMIVEWRNSAKILKHCFSKKTITEESNREFYKNNVITGRYRQFIVERIDDDFGLCSYPIASISLKDFDLENERCELCVFTSDDEEWNKDSQSQAISLTLDKAFKEYGLHKVYSYVFSDCFNEVQLLEKAGLQIEAVLKKEAKDMDGQYVDVYRLAVFKEDWAL